MKVGLLIGVIQGCVFLIEGPTKAISHDYTTPSYTHHHHHLCHVLTMALSCLVLWWAFCIFRMVRNKDVLSQKWGQRLFGVPVLVLAVVGTFTGYYMYSTYTSHDEITYASVMSLANGVFLIVLMMYCYTFVTHPVIEEKDYGWNYMLMSVVFYSAYFVIFFVNNLWPPAILAAAAILPLWYGIIGAKFIIAQKML